MTWPKTPPSVKKRSRFKFAEGGIHAPAPDRLCRNDDDRPSPTQLTRPNLQQRHPSDPPEELPNLPSSRRSGPDVAPRLRRRAPLGQSDKSRGSHSKDAALVRRPQVRPLLE